jgi:hypothetical protein
MVDSSVGGKTGVDLREGKNLVGAFHQPQLVAIDSRRCARCPQRERAAGLAEVVKKAAIWDAELFAALERDAEALLALDESALVPALTRASEIKAEVVRRDERESGRACCSTSGTRSRTRSRRSRATGAAARRGRGDRDGLRGGASEALGHAPLGTAARLEKLCRRLGLPTEPPGFARSAYLAALRVDKKKQDSRIHYVVLEGVGSARTVPLLPSQIAAALPARPRRSAGSVEAARRRRKRESGGRRSDRGARARAARRSRRQGARRAAAARARRPGRGGELHRAPRGVGRRAAARRVRARPSSSARSRPPSRSSSA